MKTLVSSYSQKSLIVEMEIFSFGDIQLKSNLENKFVCNATE